MKALSPSKNLAIASILGFGTAHAALTAPIGTVNNNANITAIYGGGNPNNSWVTSSVDDITVGVRFKERSTLNFGTTDGLGGTTFTVGVNVNLDFTVSSGSAPLSGYKFILSVDRNASLSQTWTTIDVTSMYPDNSFGTSATANGAGLEGLWSTYATTNTVAQNSQRSFWLTIPGNPTPDAGQYNVALTAYNVSDVGFTNPIAQTVSTLTVVPEPSSSLALALSTIGFLTIRRRQR